MNKLRETPTLDDTSDYLTWKKEVAVWQLGTSASAKQQAAKLIMNMSGKPREVSLNISVAVLGADDGVAKLIAELDKLYCKDTTQSLFKAIDTFERYRRSNEEDIDKYILEFQRKYKALTQLQGNKDQYSDVILAYRLLNQANLSQEQQRLVKATCTDGLTYAKMQEQLKRTFGDSLGGKTASPIIKEEPVFYTRGDDNDWDHYENGQQQIYWTGDSDKFRGYRSRPVEHNPQWNSFHPDRGYRHHNNRYNPYAQKRSQRSYPQRGSQRPYQQKVQRTALRPVPGEALTKF